MKLVSLVEATVIDFQLIMEQDSISNRFDLTKDPKTLQQGSEQWELTSSRIRESLEKFGYLLVRYDTISGHDRQQLFESTASLFDLPVETKRRNSTFKDSLSIYPGDVEFLPLYEALGVLNAEQDEKARAFANLMWPDGNAKFSNILSSMSKKMLDLSRLLMSMIMDSYGSGKHLESVIGRTDALFHMIKYSAPTTNEPELGLASHTDIDYLTVLCQNEVAGLSIMNREGDWVQVDPGQSYFVVFVGQSLRAWSNGRMYAPFHRVMFSGVKDRLACASFLMAKADEMVEAPREFVDGEHPRLFRPYAYGEFVRFSREAGATSEDILDMFAGI